MPSRQETFLLFLAYSFVGIKRGFSKETTGRFFFRFFFIQKLFNTLRCNINVIVHMGILEVAKYFFKISSN